MYIVRFSLIRLTVGAVLPYKARHTRAIVVIHSVNACSIVKTRVWITVVSVYGEREI